MSLPFIKHVDGFLSPCSLPQVGEIVQGPHQEQICTDIDNMQLCPPSPRDDQVKIDLRVSKASHRQLIAFFPLLQYVVAIKAVLILIICQS